MRKDHLVYADVKHCGTKHFWTSVVFGSVGEIDALIAALSLLRDQADDPHAHCHLQHYNLNKSSSAEEGEITFHSPAFQLDPEASDRVEFAAEAKRMLENWPSR